jgi:hypothetical protein
MDEVFELIQRMLRVLNDEDAERFLVWLDAQDGSLTYGHFCQAYEVQRPEAARKFFDTSPEEGVIDLMEALKKSLKEKKV